MLSSSVSDPVLAKFGYRALYPERWEIFKILLNECSRYFCNPPFLFSYFWCQTSSVSPRSLDPDPDAVRILPDSDLDPGWFSGFRTSMERLTKK